MVSVLVGLLQPKLDEPRGSSDQEYLVYDRSQVGPQQFSL